MIKVGFDIGGVLSKHPDIFQPMIEALNAHPAFEVHVLTDVLPPRSFRLVQENNITVPPERIHSCDYARYGDTCKAEKVRELGITLMIDDHLPYLLPMREDPVVCLRVLPDGQDMFHPNFKQCRD